MTNKTAVDGKGIFQLGLIQDFFKKMKIPISEIKIIGDYFDLDCHYNRNFRKEILRNSFEYLCLHNSSGVAEIQHFIIKFRNLIRFHNLIEKTGLCPAAKTVINTEPHGVVIDKFIDLDRRGNPYYNCKNTNKNNRNVRVGFSDHPDIYPLIEAVLIRFERK